MVPIYGLEGAVSVLFLDKLTAIDQYQVGTRVDTMAFLGQGCLHACQNVLWWLAEFNTGAVFIRS